jgi:hypothetical protein
VYILTSALSALSIGMLKCAWNVGKFVPQAHLGGGSQPGGGSGGAGVSVWKGWFGLLGLGQENFLGFLLFWIGGYALIHGEWKVWRGAGVAWCALRRNWELLEREEGHTTRHKGRTLHR